VVLLCAEAKTELMVVVPAASGALRRILRTNVAKLITGQSSGSPVRFCVRDSPLWPFFWLGRRIDTEVAV